MFNQVWALFIIGSIVSLGGLIFLVRGIMKQNDTMVSMAHTVFVAGLVIVAVGGMIKYERSQDVASTGKTEQTDK